jgi:ribonuclease HI
MTDWIDGWKENGWTNSRGYEVVNRAEMEELDEISQQINIRYVSLFLLVLFSSPCA